MIAIIDYDMGNLRSVSKAFEKLGATTVITRDPQVIAKAERVVLPGVGAFRDCMGHIEEYGLVEPIKEAVAGGRPFLAICIGLQLLFEESHEDGIHKGLGIVKGRVVRFPKPHREARSDYKIPHMGWNSIKRDKDSALLTDIPDGEYFYFVHSYYAECEEPGVTLTTTEYGVEFVSSIERDNLMATQFHPEKSQTAGLKLLKNFLEI